MTYEELVKRKSELFGTIMEYKYKKNRVPNHITEEYRFLQREQKRMNKEHRKVLI